MHLGNIQALYLQSNQLSQIEGLEALTNLRFLALHGNAIWKLEGMQGLRGFQPSWLCMSGWAALEKERLLGFCGSQEGGADRQMFEQALSHSGTTSVSILRSGP